MIRLTSDNTFTIDAAAGDAPRRQISGVAVEYNKTATVSDGTKVMFMPGSLSAGGKNPKLYMQHDSTQILGQVTERQDVGTAMMFVAKISATRLGDELLILASDGTIDSVSVGVNPTKWHDDKGVMVIESAVWQELSFVSVPAFEGSIITDIAASIPQDEPEISTIETEPTQETETMSEVTATPEVEATIPTSPIFAAAKREPRIPNSWEYMAAFHKGGDSWVNAQKVFAEYTAYHKSPLQAAAGDEFLTSVPGLLTQVTMGPVFQDINFMRPVVAALGARAMPQTPSSTFNRPTITTHQATATSQTEGSAVATTTGVIANNTVTKKTFANSANISYQTLDFTDPAALQIVINDLIGGYMVGTDNEAADNLLAAATSAGVWDLSVADLMTSIYDAAVVTLAATNYLPTHMFVDPATYALIMKLADTTGRPLFANFGGPGLQGINSIGAGNVTSAADQGMNPYGPLGLKLVVDNNFAAKTMVIMKDIGFEIYEDWKGILSLDSPTTLTRAVSTHGYFCTFKANASMIQKITQA
jgi:HK97 family phage prohead protease